MRLQLKRPAHTQSDIWSKLPGSEERLRFPSTVKFNQLRSVFYAVKLIEDSPSDGHIQGLFWVNNHSRKGTFLAGFLGRTAPQGAKTFVFHASDVIASQDRVRFGWSG